MSRCAALGLGGARGDVRVDSRVFELTDRDGQTVFADVVDRPATSLLILTPNQPLRPKTRYTATLAAGLTDVWGNRLAVEVTWSFVTEGGW